MSTEEKRRTDVEEEDTQRRPRLALSMRAKFAVGGFCFFTSMILIAGSGLPYLVSALQSQQNRPSSREVLVLLRMPVVGEILTYSLQKNISTSVQPGEQEPNQQSGTYTVEIVQASNETKTYVQRQQGAGEAFAQTFNLTYLNELRTYWLGSHWANETEKEFLTPLNLHLQNLHILPLPEAEVGVGDSWRLEHHGQGEEFGRQETIWVQAEFTLEDEEEVVTEAGRFQCYVIRGVWEAELVSRNLSTGAEIGRGTEEAQTIHWIDSGSRFVVKAQKVEMSISDGWLAQLPAAMMGFEDYRSFTHFEAELRMALILIGRRHQGT